MLPELVQRLTLNLVKRETKQRSANAVLAQLSGSSDDYFPKEYAKTPRVFVEAHVFVLGMVELNMVLPVSLSGIHLRSLVKLLG